MTYNAVGGSERLYSRYTLNSDRSDRILAGEVDGFPYIVLVKSLDIIYTPSEESLRSEILL